MTSMGKEWVRENEKRSEFFGFALSQPVSSQWSLHRAVSGVGGKERDAWLEQDRIAQMAMAKVKGGKGMCGGGKKGK